MGKAVEPCIYEYPASKRHPAGFRVQKFVVDQWGDRRKLSEIFRPQDESDAARERALEQARAYVRRLETEKRDGRIYRRFDRPAPSHSVRGRDLVGGVPWHEHPQEHHDEINADLERFARDADVGISAPSRTLCEWVERGMTPKSGGGYKPSDEDFGDNRYGYLRRIYEDKSKGQWSKSSGAWSTIKEWGGIHRLRLKDITGQDVDAFVRWCEKQDGRYRASTIKGYRTVLKAIIKDFAGSQKATNPLVEVPPTKTNIQAEGPARKTPTRAEAQTIEAALAERARKRPHPARSLALAIWRLQIETGLRPGEALALTVAHIDFDRLRIIVEQALSRDGEIGRTKSGKRNENLNRRIVPIVQKTANLLKEWIRSRPSQDSNLVFPTQKGEPWTAALYRDQLAACCADLPDWDPELQVGGYMARHFAIAEARRNEMPLVVAMKIFAHEDIRTHTGYGEPEFDELRDWVNRMDSD